MTTSATASDQPDYVALYAHYKGLNRGHQAELRRVADLEALTLQPTLYRLFPGLRPGSRQQRLAFFLPWVPHQNGAGALAAQWAKQGVNEARVLQIARMDSPDDLVQLRRLLMSLKLQVDWADFGQTLWFWGPHAKRNLIETYYLTLYAPKGK